MSMKRVFSFCTIAAAGLLAAPLVMAGGHSGGGGSYIKCGDWKVTPTNTSGQCSDCVGIDYQIVASSYSGGSPDHVAVLVGGTNTDAVVVPPGNQVYPPPAGDPVTGLGAGLEDFMAVKVNPSSDVKIFPLVVKGGSPITTTMAIKKGSKTSTCSVPGLGTPAPDFSEITSTETVRFEDCEVKFDYDPVTKEVHAALTDESVAAGCSFMENDITDVEITVAGMPLGTVQKGEGYMSSGEHSCTTRIIGGKVYTWGKPCP